MEGGIWNFFLSLSRAGHSKMWEMFRGESRSQKSQDRGNRFDRIWAGMTNAESREGNFVLSGELVRRGLFERVGFEVR